VQCKVVNIAIFDADYDLERRRQMELNELIFLFIIERAKGKIELMRIKKEIERFQDKRFDLHLDKRNFYNIIRSIENKGLIEGERIKGLPPTRVVRITPAGENLVQFCLFVLKTLIEPEKEKENHEPIEEDKI
jgi:DNA-binding PadR family transcriptional regulator